jgi:hypothetical protein
LNSNIGLSLQPSTARSMISTAAACRDARAIIMMDFPLPETEQPCGDVALDRTGCKAHGLPDI